MILAIVPWWAATDSCLAVMPWLFLLVGTCRSSSTMIVRLWYWYSASHLLCHNQLLIATILWLRPSATMLYGFKGWWWYVHPPAASQATRHYFYMLLSADCAGHMICWTISNVIWTLDRYVQYAMMPIIFTSAQIVSSRIRAQTSMPHHPRRPPTSYFL